ncbi:MAG: virulence RhuM family protein [Treponema sp.]|jgi:hypothetical protein|nr:virulence RhuM family protein [Treponema sp.]
MKEITIRSSAAEYLTFVAATGESSPQGGGVEVIYEDENVWLSQKMMALLYDVDVRTVNEHLKNIFLDNELEETSVIRNFRITASDGKQYNTKHYSLEAIIAVGYKVNSSRAVQFRKWATGVIKDYAIQGWAMDTPRLKSGGSILAKAYFEKLLAEIREIRLSERKFYQKITDIYATALDYDKSAATTKTFFATVQNKLHWAIHGHTAAEVIAERADAKKPHMGLTSWEAAPDGKVQKYDVSIAKNYLTGEELDGLERIVTTYLDYAELQAGRNIPMTMEDWKTRLDAFLKFTEYEILNNPGKVTAEIAKSFAESEFEKYRIVQDRLFKSDFDKMLEELERKEKKGRKK